MKNRKPLKIRLESDNNLPVPEDLEASLESKEKCPMCEGRVRAIVQQTDVVEYGVVDVLVRLYCPSCGWTAAQWRTWRWSSPKELC